MSQSFEPVTDRIVTDETVRVGDETDIDIHLTHDDGSNVDLTDQTVRIRIETDDHTTVVDASAAVTNATGGEVRYTLGENDLPSAGLYLVELEIEDAVGRSITVPTEESFKIEAVRTGGE